MKVFRILIQRPTKKGGETLLERFAQGEIDQQDVLGHYDQLFEGLIINVEEVKEIALLKKANKEKVTTILKNDGDSYGHPHYRFPLESLDKEIQDKVLAWRKQKETLAATSSTLDHMFMRFMNEPRFSSIDGSDVVNVSGYLHPIVLPNLNLGKAKDVSNT